MRRDTVLSMAIQMTTVALDKGLHQDMRRYCAETGMKVKGVINKALVEFLEREEARQVIRDHQRKRKGTA